MLDVDTDFRQYLARVSEAIPLAGVTWLGCLAGDNSTPYGTQAELVASMFLLALFAFRFNDIQDLQPDSRIPERAREARKLAARSTLSIAAELSFLLLASLSLSWLAGGPISLSVATAGAACAFAYSWRKMPLKQVAVAASIVHLAGADLAFCLGWWGVSDASWHAPVAGLTFGLVFAAGHLHHEAAHFGQDKIAGVRTQAVRFGPRACLSIGVVCWLLSALPLSICAWFCDRLPESIAWLNMVLVAGYLLAARYYGVLSAGEAGLRRLRRFYRVLYAAGGIVMAAVLLAG